MANLRDIRRRIKSISNTSQITRAMQLVAASKMKKAQDQALAGRHYAESLNRVLVNLADRTDDEGHPLLEQRETGTDIMIVVSTDKGLCGGLNTNLMRMVLDECEDDTRFVTVGNKGRQSLARGKKDLVADFPAGDPLKFAEIRTVSKYVTEQFLGKEGEESNVRQVRVAFTNFVTTLSQTPYIATLLPVSPIELTQKKEYEGMGKDDDVSEVYHPVDSGAGYIFEPTPNEVFDNIIPHYVAYQLYQMALEARASEHSARMVAMKSATDNAESLVKDLTLEYNKVRQAAITNELLEITTAMKALE